jgi:hypothetical protein
VLQDIEIFKNIASGIQSLAIAVGVIIGGIWTFYMFRLQRRSAIGIDISGTQLAIPGGEPPCILVSLTITNHGNRPTRLVWNEKPVCVAKVSTPADGSSVIKFILRTPISFLSESGQQLIERSTGIRPGDSKHYEVITSVDTPGLYQLTFMAEVDKEHITESEKAIGRLSWKATSHIVIHE